MNQIDLALLRRLRKKRGLTQKQVATALGYKTSVGYHYIEKGRCSLHADQLAKLAQLYDVPIEFFLKTELPHR